MKILRVVFLVLLLGTTYYACKKDSGPTAPGGGGEGLTEEQKAAIRAGYQAIAPSADSILRTANPLAGFQAALASYRSNPNVENAWITNNTLFVKFRNGGIVAWNIATSIVVPPYEGPASGEFDGVGCLLKPSELIGNTKALLINTQYGDESRQYNRDLITYLEGKFQARGFTSTTMNGTAANVSFFKTGLKQYGAIFYIAHGCYDGTNTWQTTGEVGSLDSVMAKYPTEWRSNQLSVGTVDETHGGVKVAVKLYMFTQRLIDSMYVANDFPKSMIYLVACQGLKDAGRQVAVSLVNKGARGVIGWDETNCLGQSTGKKLFTTLLCGANLKQAVNALPAEAKLDPCEVQPGASLLYYPTSADTLRLVDSVRAQLSITTPKKDSTYTTRNLTLAGSLINGDSIASGIAEINGIATRMTLTGSRTFSQPIVIDSGANSIHISCTGKLTNGRCAYVDTTFQVKGNFAALPLWTELRWNTISDVDFHLLRPGASFPGSFWTSNDCNYTNRSTSWGAFLDVDNTFGYGPEHITIPTVIDTGTYRLFVHYYYAPSGTVTSASVSVRIGNGPIQNFGPYTLTSPASRGGTIWESCTIHFPGGQITPVNQLRTVGLFKFPPASPKGKKY